MRDVLEAVTAGQHLTRDQARAAFDRIMAGEISPEATAALLAALRTKGECVDEVVGAAQAMRAQAVRIAAPPDCVDTCGTGGDGISTFNVSTAAALIAAAAGATVAKHGNRSTTRASGSTDALDALGLDTNAPPPVVERCLREARIGYLNARQLHPAMRHAAPVRQALQIRTIFNLLGPLTSPAGARRQVLGVPSEAILELIAGALQELGAEHAWVVHGHDGLCDLTTTAKTTVIEVTPRGQRRFTVSPADASLPTHRLDDLRVDSPQASAAVIQQLLEGEPGPARDHALINAAAALVVAGRAENLRAGVTLAAAAIDSGAARATLEQWRQLAPAPVGGDVA